MAYFAPWANTVISKWDNLWDITSLEALGNFLLTVQFGPHGVLDYYFDFIPSFTFIISLCKIRK